MKYLRELCVLLLCCFGGDMLSYCTGDRLPGNVLGMALLLVLLIVGVVKLPYVEHTADFLLGNMAFFFLPACLGIMDVFGEIKDELLAIAFICILTTFLTAAATALAVHLVLRLQHRTGEEAFDHD